MYVCIYKTAANGMTVKKEPDECRICDGNKQRKRLSVNQRLISNQQLLIETNKAKYPLSLQRKFHLYKAIKSILMGFIGKYIQDGYTEGLADMSLLSPI